MELLVEVPELRLPNHALSTDLKVGTVMGGGAAPVSICLVKL